MNFLTIHEGEIKLKRIITIILIVIMAISVSGCAKQEVFLYESIDKEWSIEVPNEYTKDQEENKDGSYYISYKNKKGGIFSINETVDKDTVVNEENIEKDLGGDSYLHIERKEILDVEGVGKVYGILIKDHSTNGYMFYYKLRINDKVINLLIYQKNGFTVEEEAKIKSMIGNIKILK